MPFEDLLSREMIEQALAAVEPLPPRPPHTLPEFAITMKGKLIRLTPMTVAQWDYLEIKKVTGTGWPAWYPATHVDKLSFATRGKGKAREKEKAAKANRNSDDYLSRRR